VNKIEKTIEKVIKTPNILDDELANRLLEEFHRGAPVAYLRRLLLSDDPEIASSGAWIASELGEKGNSLLDTVVVLLEHPDKRVRFWIIDCLLLWAGASHQRELANTVRLIDDPEKAVRWKVMVFLSRASKNQLEAALAWLQRQAPESPNVGGLQWLVGPAGGDVESIESMLRNPEPLLRKYAAVAAARMAKHDRHPLAIAASSGDSEVAEFAADSPY
jgi:hypothetical protein